MTVRDKLIGKKFPVLDQGFVTLIDVMGSDQDIVDAARISYGKGTRKTSGDEDLIRYLMRHKHSTPFEMSEIKIHVRVPMDCWRQWIRHRTANVNEYSTRYSEAIDAKQETKPDEWRLQSATNKQGSSGFVPEHGEAGAEFPSGWNLTYEERIFHEHADRIYRDRLNVGVAREQARKDLPLSTYTEAIWKCDLRNTLGFLALRMDGHAQKEIREAATIIGREIIAPLFPLTWQAFETYTLNAMTLSAKDIEAAQAMCNIVAPQQVDEYLSAIFSNAREREECRMKLERIGVIRVDSGKSFS
jgi:thymidylate synthase (FAD)